MDHRIQSGGDEPESGVTVAFHSSGAKARRKNENLSPRRVAGEGKTLKYWGQGGF